MKTYKSQLDNLSLVKEKSSILRVKISSSLDAADYMRKFWKTDIEIYESFFLLLLNRANNTIGYVKISQGGVSGTVVDPKIVAKYAIESLASGVIVAHNHPSGNTQPSQADNQMTKKLKEGLKYFDISLLDHLILTEDDYLSYSDSSLL